MPIRPLSGGPSPEDVAAVLAILAATRVDDGSDRTDRVASVSGRLPHEQWSSRARMLRKPHSHGPGGWRASALPR